MSSPLESESKHWVLFLHVFLAHSSLSANISRVNESLNLVQSPQGLYPRTLPLQVLVPVWVFPPSGLQTASCLMSWHCTEPSEIWKEPGWSHSTITRSHTPVWFLPPLLRLPTILATVFRIPFGLPCPSKNVVSSTEGDRWQKESSEVCE